MSDFQKALAAAREALADADFNAYGVKVTYASALADLLAALDAQPIAGEVWQYRANSTSRGKEWIDCRDERAARDMEALGFEIRCLYAAPPAALDELDHARSRIDELTTQLDHARRRIGELTIQLGEAMKPAAAVPPERDWTMIQSGDTSIPAWVIHYANAIGAYMKGQNVQHWAVGPVQSRNEAPQPAAAVPDDVARDAARYRWLRNDSGNAFNDPVIQGKYIGSPKADWLTGEHADEAIDRAMLAAERKETSNE